MSPGAASGSAAAVRSGLRPVRSGLRPVRSGLRPVRSGLRPVRSGLGPVARGWARCAGQARVSAASSARLRVLLGSTGMPGPIVVVKVTFFRYRPLAAAGLSLITSSRAAA